MGIPIDRAGSAVAMAGHDNFAVVEPNHLSAPRSGGVYAQLPCAEAIGNTLENGQFVKYDYAAGECNFTGKGAWMLVFNEEKLPDERKQMHRDYAMQKADFYDGKMVPRVFRLYAGDIYTTNAVEAGTYSKGDVLVVDEATGFLKAGDTEAGKLALEVAAETTMPDGQPGLKLRVISE